MLSRSIDLTHVLITGGSGMVGQAIPFGLKPTRAELDVTCEAQVSAYCEEAGPSAIICLSSINLRRCEEAPLDALRVNVLAVRRMAEEARRRKIPLLFVSTGTVFNGAKGQTFDEEDIPDPQNLYGQTKRLAEMMIRDTHKDHLIIRTGWLFGGSGPHHVNFIDKCVALARQGESITATADQTGSPTYMNDFIQQLRDLLTGGERGLIHIVNSGVATANDVADRIIGLMGSKSRVISGRVQQVEQGNLRRSQSEALVSKRCKLRLWTEALDQYLAATVLISR